MCKLPKTTKTVFHKGDIVRIKANDGCLIGDYYIVVSAKSPYSCFLRKIETGKVRESGEEFICAKEKLGIVKLIKLRVSEDIMRNVVNNAPSVLKLKYGIEAQNAITAFEEANKVNPINVIQFHTLYGEKRYVRFTSMMKTTKTVLHLGEKRAIPHLTIFNIIPC